MRQRVLTGIATVAVVSLGLSGCAGLFSDPGTDGLDDVTIAVEPLIGSAAVYLGAQEGFFADEGIALTINSLPPDSKAVVGMVAAGNADFGLSDTLTLLVQHGEGHQVHRQAHSRDDEHRPGVHLRGAADPADRLHHHEAGHVGEALLGRLEVGGGALSVAALEDRRNERPRHASPLQLRMHAAARLPQRRSTRLAYDLDKPVIAAINGPAAGAGLSLALARVHERAVSGHQQRPDEERHAVRPVGRVHYRIRSIERTVAMSRSTPERARRSLVAPKNTEPAV